MNKIIIFLLSLNLIIAGFIIYGWIMFGPAGTSSETEVFVVPQTTEGFDLTQSLWEKKYIKNAKGFKFLLENFAIGKEIKPGGYKLSQSMNAWQVLSKVTGIADLGWVTISYCPRKEQVGEKLAAALGWDQNKLNDWNNLY